MKNFKELEVMLKPCPFCAGKAKFTTTDDELYWVKCTNTDCETKLGNVGTPEEVSVRWNTRVKATEPMTDKSSLLGRVLDFMREHKMKVGHVVPQKPLQFNFIPTLNPKEQQEIQTVLQWLADSGYITEKLALTKAGFDLLYT